MSALLNTEAYANSIKMYSSDYSNGHKSRNNSGPQETSQERPITSAGLTTRESVELFQEAVDTARDEYQKTLFGSEAGGEALKPKLTVDLRHRSLSQLPKEVISIIKQDVERCVTSTWKLSNG